MLQFQRIQSTPVIAKGSTYGGWTADALAAPSVCWDGSRFVMTVSMWSTSNSQWATAFFTSTDLVNWTYVTSSLWVPAGGDYLIGNGGIAWFNGLYYFVYNHYGPTIKIALATSSDLVTWTPVGSYPLFTLGPSGDGSGQADPSLTVNPNNGKLEIWYIGQDSRQTMMADSPDGTTWTKQGIFQSAPALWAEAAYGEPNAYYDQGLRFITFDAATGLSTDQNRMSGSAYSLNSDTTWVTNGTVFGPNPFNSWESFQVFDMCCFGKFDLHDGRGEQLWAVYAGGDVYAPTDNTNSSIGICFLTTQLQRRGGFF